MARPSKIGKHGLAGKVIKLRNNGKIYNEIIENQGLLPDLVDKFNIYSSHRIKLQAIRRRKVENHPFLCNHHNFYYIECHPWLHPPSKYNKESLFNVYYRLCYMLKSVNVKGWNEKMEKHWKIFATKKLGKLSHPQLSQKDLASTEEWWAK